MKLTKIKKFTLGAATLGLASLPLFVLAEVTGLPDKAVAKDVSGLVTVVNSIVVALQTILFAVAALFIVIAAITYLTAGGDEEKVGKAKNMIIYAIIALVLALLAFGIDDIVAGALPARN